MSAKVTDPVCGMAFPPEKAAGQIERGGVTYYFCTAACKQQFEADPDRYATPGAGR